MQEEQILKYGDITEKRTFFVHIVYIIGIKLS